MIPRRESRYPRKVNREENMPKVKSKAKDKSAAIITIKDPDKMDKRGRRAIAQWMRRQADFLETPGGKFSSRYTARYLYR